MKNQNCKITIKSLAVAGVIVLMQACGSGTSTSPTEPAPAVNVVVDTKAPSDSKGVGKFTEVKLGAIDQAKADLGKAVFATKCTTCHKLTADKFVGPGLMGVTNRRTPEWIMNMITGPETMIKSDPVAKKLFEEILTPMANQNIGDDEARNIVEYLRQNDKK
ncbi:MAG: cytochrome c [Bacteroidota bacterium]